MEKQSAVQKHRVISMLDRKELDFLDNLGKDSLFSSGHKLSHSKILEGLVEFAMETGITGEKIYSVDDLKLELLKEIALKLEKAKKEGNHE